MLFFVKFKDLSYNFFIFYCFSKLLSQFLINLDVNYIKFKLNIKAT